MKFSQALQPKGRKTSDAVKTTVYVGQSMPIPTAQGLAKELCGYTEQESSPLVHGNGGSDLFRSLVTEQEIAVMIYSYLPKEQVEKLRAKAIEELKPKS